MEALNVESIVSTKPRLVAHNSALPVLRGQSNVPQLYDYSVALVFLPRCVEVIHTGDCLPVY